MTIAVDFDGVIHAYSLGWCDGSIYDPPMPGALAGLRTLMEHDAVFVFTSRDTQQVADWLFERGEFDITWEPPGEVICEFWNDRDRILVTNRKLPASVYLDDRAVRFTDWDQALAVIQPGAVITNPLTHTADVGVKRVISLYEQWVKAGPPPLGTPTARWWDKRLAELRGVLHLQQTEDPS
ncbi:hypothetical protein AB0P02_01100 [Streptomyces griseoluteus]|uniref:hypothetical protein n=1 Tax=Streptomyces griseoluteus TaxID=29306 RepID=UPI0034147187